MVVKYGVRIEDDRTGVWSLCDGLDEVSGIIESVKAEKWVRNAYQRQREAVENVELGVAVV